MVNRLKTKSRAGNSKKFANSEAGEEFGIFKVLNYGGGLCKWRMFLSWSMTATEKTHATNALLPMQHDSN